MADVCRLIVLESHGTWANALRRASTVRLPPVTEVRSAAECEARLCDASASFVLVELLAPSGQSLVEHLVHWQRRFPQAALAVAADRALAAWEPLVREAGAIHVLFSPRQLTPLVATIARHATRYPASAESLPERIMAELPLG